MTSSVIKKYALAALCGAAIIGVGQSAQAATWSIVLGVPSAPSSAANYGTAPNQNNVINNPASATHDLINVPINTSIFQNSNLNAGTFVGSYNVDWFYLGSESDNKNDFAANGVALANGGVIGYQEINGMLVGMHMRWIAAIDVGKIQPTTASRLQLEQIDGTGIDIGSRAIGNRRQV